jgi:tetratricopeptide (TPR) repeat protein
MGAVYKAKDRELDRLVALKVIRPELVGNPDVLRRFKQELILARQISHKNVIRIFDLGQAEGLKFITMEYIEGQDLKTLIEGHGKFTPEEAIPIIQQICRALDAAHAEGVVHRDLKPQNVMVDRQGKISVMDFGLARSVEMQGMTQTGMMLGTPQYMSPEQAKGQKADARSDLFSLGIIFYEMLTGKVPFQADTTLATLLKRLQEPAVPPVELDSTIPQAVSDVVVKCLEVDPQHRFQSAEGILQDLEARPGTTVGRVLAQEPRPRRAVLPWKWISAGLILALMVSAGLLLREKIAPPAAPRQKAVTVLIADFDNATSDSVFDGTLEPVFAIAMEGASFISSFNRGQARRLAGQVQTGATRLDEAVARMVAVREGINVVLTGSIGRQGEQYLVSVRALDPVTGKAIATREMKAANKDGVLGAVAKLATPIRQALGDVTPESAQFAAAETFTSASLEAMHEYAMAQELQLAGKYGNAARAYSRSIELDPNLGRAYAGLAAVHYNLGQLEKTEEYYQMAMARIDRMTEREKYRTRGGYYVMVRNYEKAVEEFSALVKQYPADTAGHANLALAYSYRRELPRAIEEGRRAIEIYPRNVAQRNNLAGYLLYAGEFEAAGREARGVLGLNPDYAKGYVVLALSQLAQGQVAQAAETYQRLEKVSGRGPSFAATGLADLALYEGRLTDASALLEKGVAADQEKKDASSAAEKLAMLADAQLLSGNKAAALRTIERAVAASKQPKVELAAAQIYVQAGQKAKARAIATLFGARLEREMQAYGKLVEGLVELRRNNMPAAIKSLQEGHQLLDTWIARFWLARAYLEAQAFTEAHSEFETCLKRRGEAAALFMDEVPTYRLFPPVYYYLGRAQDGLKSDGGVESYRTFLAIKQKGGGDPLVEDARPRLGGR